MKTIRLSYVLTTFNKLSYLSVTLPLLIENKQADEEIVIVDGGSTDGTEAYLNQLYSENKIDYFLSEKDSGEAHGTNKAIMAAKGTLVKIITDDDVFYYPGIQTCKEFMLKRTDIDVLGFDGFGCSMNHKNSSFIEARYRVGFEQWLKDKTPFLLCGLSFLIRKSSLAYTGLFNTRFTNIDIEYAIRISSMNTKIAFYTGLAYVNIGNPNSNSHRFYQRIAIEKKLLSKMYPAFHNRISYRGTLIKFKEIIRSYIPAKKAGSEIEFDYSKIVSESVKRLNASNAGKHFEFLS